MFALFHRSLNANSRLMLLFECSPRECLSIIAATYEYPRRASTWMDELKEESIDSFFKSKVHSLSLSPPLSLSLNILKIEARESKSNETEGK